MSRPTTKVRALLAPAEAAREAALLRGVLAEAWAERRRQARGGRERAFVEGVIRDLAARLRELGPSPS